MSKLTRLLAKYLLWLIGVAIPVFIAACYGMPYRYTKQGRVIDRDTKQGINAIKVTCIRAGSTQITSYSGPDGGVDLDYDLPCDELLAEDTDGPANGGTYLAATIAYCEPCGDFTIELTKTP